MIKKNKALKRKGIVFILFAVSLFYLHDFSYALGEDYVEMEGVSVFIDSEKLELNEKFYNAGGHLLLPMRALFERLGANVEWIDSNRTVIARLEDKKITMSIDSNKASVNGRCIILSASPMIKDGRTYIPLRFVSESLGYDVQWNDKSRNITIKKSTKVSGVSDGLAFVSSETYKDEYIRIEVKNNNSISFEGIAPKDVSDWCFTIKKKDSSEGLSESVFEERAGIKDMRYQSSFHLDKVEDGKYNLMVYFRQAGEEEYESYYDNIGLICENGFWRIDVPAVYENNCEKYRGNDFLNPEDYLQPSFHSESEENQIRELTEEITMGAESDYEKVKRIHDWLATNIYYDWDCFLGDCGQMEVTSLEILDSKKAICSGYADLARQMMRISGIPSRVVNGHVIWYFEDWADVNHSEINHAWNEAYVDGRWITVDATWDSSNAFKEGDYREGRVKHVYFDPSLLAFSATHKIIEGE